MDPDTQKDIKENHVPINEQSIAGFVAKNRKTINIVDAYNKTEITKIIPALSFDSFWDKKTGFRTKQILTVPLFSTDNLLTGVMQLINKKSGDRFTKEDEERVQEVATTLGIAFYNQYQLARKKPTKFDYLVSSGLVTQAELDATIKEAREKQKEVEPLLMEKYKIAKKDVGKSLSIFYKCPFVEFEERLFVPPELVKNISLNYLRALSSRFRIMSRLDISERRKPQDGKIKRLIQARATVPEIHKVAVDEAMTTLVQDGVVKSIQGLTDYKQVKAVAMK